MKKAAAIAVKMIKNFPLKNFSKPKPEYNNIEPNIIIINNVCPTSRCKKTSAKQNKTNPTGANIKVKSFFTLGIFLSIIKGIYIIMAILSNSDACKFINPRLIQLFEPLMFFPIMSVKSSNSMIVPIIPTCT